MLEKKQILKEVTIALNGSGSVFVRYDKILVDGEETTYLGEHTETLRLDESNRIDELLASGTAKALQKITNLLDV